MPRARILAPSIAVVLLAGAVGAPSPGGGDTPRERVANARRAAAEARVRAERLLVAAAAESDAAARTATERAGMAARVDAAQAELVAVGTQAAVATRLLARQRATLAGEQAPVARLLAALQSLALRPSAAAIAQPGSVDDLVRLRAVLSSVIPAIRAQTGELRGQLAATRVLRARATAAEQALGAGHRRLQVERQALAQLEAQHRARAADLGRDALSESDRALALGEQARDWIDQMARDDAGQVVAAGLARLPGPSPRGGGAEGGMGAPPAGLYRLPVAGRLVTGFGEISDAGVRSRGLTFVVEPEAAVVAPADGSVRYADHFRGYGRIVIIDHGNGWTSLVTGLGTLAVVLGQKVAAGDPLGRATALDDPQVSVELRRRGQPVDAAALIG